MLKRTVLVTATTVASLGLAAHSATASGGLGAADCGPHACTSFAEQGSPAVGQSTAPASSGTDPNARICQSVPIALNKVPDQVVDLSAPGGDSGPLDAYQEQCMQGGKVVSSKLIFYPQPSASSAQALAQRAYKTLAMPQPAVVMNPGPDIPQLSGLPVWLWLQPGTWMPKSSTVSAGGVTVTLTATPTSVTWAIGDGSTVTCSGPGTPYPVAGTADGMASSPACGHTYRRISAAEPGGAFEVSATVNWRVVWTGFGPGGTFPNVTSSVHFPVKVVESAALVTSSHG